MGLGVVGWRERFFGGLRVGAGVKKFWEKKGFGGLGLGVKSLKREIWVEAGVKRFGKRNFRGLEESKSRIGDLRSPGHDKSEWKTPVNAPPVSNPPTQTQKKRWVFRAEHRLLACLLRCFLSGGSGGAKMGLSRPFEGGRDLVYGA